VVCNLACAGEYFEMAMRFVDAVEVRRVLTFPNLIAALEAAHGRTKMGFKMGSSAARANNTSSAMPLTAAAGSGATNMTGAIRGDPDLSGSN
jgi:hypothetical protein